MGTLVTEKEQRQINCAGEPLLKGDARICSRAPQTGLQSGRPSQKKGEFAREEFVPNTQLPVPSTQHCVPNIQQAMSNTQQVVLNTQQVVPNTQRFLPNTQISKPKLSTVWSIFYKIFEGLGIDLTGSESVYFPHSEPNPPCSSLHMRGSRSVGPPFTPPQMDGLEGLARCPPISRT